MWRRQHKIYFARDAVNYVISSLQVARDHVVSYKLCATFCATKHRRAFVYGDIQSSCSCANAHRCYDTATRGIFIVVGLDDVLPIAEVLLEASFDLD